MLSAQDTEDKQEDNRMEEIAAFEVRDYMRTDGWQRAVGSVKRLAPAAKERTLRLMLQSATAPRLEEVMRNFIDRFCDAIASRMTASRASSIAQLMLLWYAPGTVELVKMYVLTSAEFMCAEDAQVREASRVEFDRFAEEHSYGYTPPPLEMEDSARMFAKMADSHAGGIGPFVRKVI